MDLGHGFLPRIDARNYKAVERCLPREGPGLFNVGLDLPWAILEGPWAIDHGASTIELCRDRGVSFFVDTQAWRYRDPRTFSVDKFTHTPYAPTGPLGLADRAALGDFVEADLTTQAALGASAYLLPGFIPNGPRDDIRGETLSLLEIIQAKLPQPLPCVAFIGAHTSSMEAAQRLIDDLPHWIGGIYLQLTPVDPLRDSPSKIIDGLMLMRHAVQQGFTVIAGRLAGLTPLLRSAGIAAVDAGLGEGESFAYGSKVNNHRPRTTTQQQPRLPMGRLYVPQLGRSLSSREWARLMEIPALRGQLLCRLPCCAFGQPVESTSQRGREHSLHSRVADAKALSGPGNPAVDHAIAILERRQSTARLMTASLREAAIDPVSTEFLDNHLAVARYLRDASSAAA